MADRYPLIYNPTANQIQELQSGDSLNVGNATITGISSIVGILSATTFSGDASGLTNVPAGTLDSVTNSGNSTNNSITVGDITAGVVTATSFKKTGGTSSEFLKADGSSDSTTYLSSETFTAVGIQSAGTSIGNATTLNFIGVGNTFAVNGNTIDVSIQGSAGGSGGGGALDITSCLFI